MRLKAGHVIILTAIIASVIGTFFASNAITGLTATRQQVAQGNFADITGRAVSDQKASASGMQTAAGAILFAMIAITGLVLVARVGREAFSEARRNTSQIKNRIQMAEDAIENGSHKEAHFHYNAIREQYAKLKEHEKAAHYPRIARIHRQLLHKSNVREAQYLTDKYVNGRISPEEFRRLKQMVISQ